MQIVGKEIDVSKKAQILLKSSEAYKKMDVQLNEDSPGSEFYMQYWCWVVPQEDAESLIADDEDEFDIEEWKGHLAEFTHESRNEDFFDPERSLRSFISEKIQSDTTEDIDTYLSCLVENMILPREKPPRGRPPSNKSWNQEFACWVVDPQRIDPQEDKDKFADIKEDLAQLYEHSYKNPLDKDVAACKFNQVLEKYQVSVEDLTEAAILPYSHKNGCSNFVGAYLDLNLACMVKREMVQRKRKLPTQPQEQEPSKKIRQELVVTQVQTQFRIMVAFFDEKKTLLTVLKNNIDMMEKLVKHKDIFQLTLRQIESFAELAMAEADNEMQRHSAEAFIGTIKLVDQYFK